MNPDRWQQIDRLLEGALDRKPEERPAFLEQACGADPLLRRDVEALLEAHDKAGSFVQEPALNPAAAPAQNRTTDSLLGKRLGPYEVLSLIGRGGMGEVYQWEKDKFMGVELYNKVLGIIGAGQIGSHLTKMAQGIGMSVVAFDPYLAPERAERMGVTMVDLEELFRRADVISVHTPLTPETRGIINAQAIAKMKPGVLIVNCARGGIINELDLCQALKTKRVAAAAFDVFEEEPVKPDNPLLALDNFICTPHIGAQTTEAQENVAIGIAEQIVDYFTKGVARGAVNIPSVAPELLPRLQPFLTLAEKLGTLQTQLVQGGIERVTVEYSGEVASLSIARLTIAVLKGLLSPIMEHPVNYDLPDGPAARPVGRFNLPIGQPGDGRAQERRRLGISRIHSVRLSGVVSLS